MKHNIHSTPSAEALLRKVPRCVALLLLLLASLLPKATWAQVAMRDMIVSMPDSLLPLLTQVNREDCVDFREAGMPARVTHRLGAVAELAQLTPDYALWQYTEGTQYAMKLLPLADSLQILCVVHRILEPVCDASICFFTTRWQPLPVATYFARPTKAYDRATLTTFDITLSDASSDLTLTQRNECYRAASQGACIDTLTQVIVYHWTGTRYVADETIRRKE